MATSGYISDSQSSSARGAYISHTLKLNWEIVSQDAVTNTSTCKFKLQHVVNGNGAAQSSVTYPYSINVEGQNYSGTATSTYKAIDKPTNTLTEFTVPIQHLANGTKSFNYSFSVDGGDYTASGIGELDAIIRHATLVSAPDFNDEENPQIRYYNPSGSKVSLLQAAIVPTGDGGETEPIIAYRNILTSMPTADGSVYHTFNFTDAERETLIAHIGDSRLETTVDFCIKTEIDGYVFYSKLTRKLSLINYKPTFYVTLRELNPDAANLTGRDDGSAAIGYVSDIEYQIHAQGAKGARIVRYSAETYGDMFFTQSGIFYDIDSDLIRFVITDSRGIVATDEYIIPNFVTYYPVTCNMDVAPLNAVGKTTLTISGKCTKGSFGSQTNQLVVQWRYRTDETWSAWDWQSVDIQSDNTYNISIDVDDLEYSQVYTFEAEAVDMVGTATTGEIKSRSRPVFDWSRDDFNFNVPVTFAAGFNIPNRPAKQLWNGQNSMNSSTTTITLIEPVSEQANGIVLIFTPYDSSTGLANDAKMQAFFIPKMAVFVMPSKMHTFHLIDGANFATVGAKSLYIGDSRISGYANNSVSGTANGITYNNSKFVLRYVLGV